jgi:16S rRNA G966 N2-methylase RsmD
MTEYKHLAEIIVRPNRFRKDMGDIDELASSINEIGLLQPIVVTRENVLVAGGRRLEAVRRLGWETIPVRVIDIDAVILGEFAENVIRKDFTVSERVAIGRAVEEELGERRGNPNFKSAIPENFPEFVGRETRELAAERAGFGNPKTYQQAKVVIESGAPELVDAVDKGEVSVSAAAEVATLPIDEQTEIVAKGEEEIIRTANRIKREKKEQRIAARKQEVSKKAASIPPSSERYILRNEPCINALDIAENSVDWIITDPPYPREYLPVYDDLARVASRVLKPGGSLLCMIGQSYLPNIISILGEHLTYQWTIAYLTPGESAQVFQRRVNPFWKPVLWFVKGEYAGRWIGDVVKSDENDKRFHHWGQSESGMNDLMSRFVNPGDIVLDPFMGAGTTGVAAIKLGASFIGFDNNADSFNEAVVRMDHAKLVA